MGINTIWSTKLRVLGIVLLAAGAASCADDDDDVAGLVPGINTGTLEQSWTIEGTRDVGKCEQYRADRMRIVVFAPDGEVHATEFTACSFFQTTLTLLTDRYTANATFVDAQGNPVSQTLTIPEFTISSDERTVLTPLDFNADAMMP